MNEAEREQWDRFYRATIRIRDCACEAVDGEVEHCETHQAVRDAARRVAHLPD